MRSLFILLLAIFCLLRISASDRVDSLNKVLTLYKNEGDIHATISTLTELGLSHQRNQKFKEALLHFKQAHQLSLRHGPKEEEVTLKVKLGTTLSWMDEYDESLRYHLQALTLKDLLSPKEVASLLVQISQTYRFKGDYANAAKHQYQGLAISESIQDSMGIVLGHFMLSSIYNYSGQDEKAYEESYKAYDAYQLYFPDEVSEYLHLIIHGVASVESKQEDLTKYEYFTRRSMEVALELDHGYTIASSHGAMGSMHLTMGVFDSAAYYFSKAVTYFEEAGIKQDQGLYQEHLGAAYRQLGEIPKSMESLNKALVIAKEIDATDLEKRVYEELYFNYEALGNYEQANTYMKKYISLKDSILSEANQKKVDELREQYEIQKRETEIEELKAENQKRINRLYLLALIFGVAFFVVIFWLLYVRYKSKARG
ncbi:MAG: tetratricopeptide repeat protein, partial [Bacteroidota bacterium]